LHKQLCEKHEAESLADDSCKAFSFGRGYAMARDLIDKFLAILSRFRDKGVHVVLIGHATVVRHDPPDMESYDKYELSVDKRAAGLVREWSDEVWFLRYREMTRPEDVGFGRERNIAIGDGERVLYAQERPAWSAKSRLGLPDKLTVKDGFLDKYLRSEEQMVNTKRRGKPAVKDLVNDAVKKEGQDA
jgi:hypothetical protein